MSAPLNDGCPMLSPHPQSGDASRLPETADGSDQRVYFRYAPVFWGRGSSLRVGRLRYPARVLDESLGGIGVESVQAFAPQVGDVLTVEREGQHRRARVAFRREYGQRVVRLGLSWVREEQKTA